MGSSYSYTGIFPVYPSKYKVNNKRDSAYAYIAYMLDRTQQMFKYSGLPETIPARDLELLLQVNGYAAIAKAGDTLYAFYGGLGGVPDAYYMPTICIVNNPYLNFNKELKIHEDTAIITNDSMYSGLIPMFSKYAELLTENDITFRLASINARMMQIISAGDDVTKAAAQKYIKDIEDGKNGVIGEGAFFDGVKVQAGATTGAMRLTELIEYNQYLRASWFNDLGIEANYNMKREALNSDEVKLNIKALLPLAENMLECRKRGLEEVNKLFDTNITVEFAGIWEDTAAEVENIDQVTDEPEDQPEEPEKETEGGADEV